MGKQDKYKIDPEKLLSFSEETIDGDITALPKDYYFLQRQRNKASFSMKEASHEKAKLRAEITIAEKSSPSYDRTPSDKFVEAIVQDAPEYQEIKANLLELERTFYNLDAIVKAIEIKAKLMQTLSSNSRYNK